MWARNVRLTLFFGQLISICIAGYMEFLFAGYYNLNNKLYGTSGDEIGVFTGYLAFIITCVFSPLSLIFLMCQRRRDLHRYYIYNILGEYYAGFTTSSRWNLLYYINFGARRLIYVDIVMNWEDHSWAQVIVLEFMNIFTIIYFGLMRPMSTLSRNRLELFNEFCVQIVTLHMVCFSEFVPGRFEKDVMGWSMVFFIAINVVWNMGSIFRIQFLGFRLIFIRYKNQFLGYMKSQTDAKFLPYLLERDEKDSNSGTILDPHGHFGKNGAKLTHFKIPFDPLKKLEKAVDKKLPEIPEVSEDYSDRDNAKPVRRYHSLMNIDYETIPKTYGEDQIRLPQMVIVLEMIKNGEIIIETLDPTDEDFLPKFYEQRNQVEVRNMKELSIQDTIFKGQLSNTKKLETSVDDGIEFDGAGSDNKSRASDAYLV